MASKIRVETVLAAVVVAVGLLAMWTYWFWHVHNVESPVGGEAAVGAVVASGVAAGLISGRLRDSIVSWVVAVIVAAVAYQATYAIDPAWPRSEDPFEAVVVIDAIFLLATVGGGHILGAAARRYRPRIRFDRIAAKTR
jgi:uncharacterized membrane protein YfcA